MFSTPPHGLAAYFRRLARPLAPTLPTIFPLAKGVKVPAHTYRASHTPSYARAAHLPPPPCDVIEKTRERKIMSFRRDL